MNCLCASTHGHFCPLSNLIFFLQFSLNFWEKTFWWARVKNIQTPLFIFLSPHSTKHTSKKFSFSFSLQSIHPISLPNKHTLRVRLIGGWKSVRIEIRKRKKSWRTEEIYFSLICVWLGGWKSGKIENFFVWLWRKVREWKM